MPPYRLIVPCLGVVCLWAFASPARADDYTLTIQNHRFVPTDITIPADT
jgi:hypothetical protein